MRNRDTIEREIVTARHDLELSLGELKHIVQDKLDVRAAAHRAIQPKRDELRVALIHANEVVARALSKGAVELVAIANRGKSALVTAYDRTSSGVRRRPYLFAGVLAGVMLAASVLFYLRHRSRT